MFVHELKTSKGANKRRRIVGRGRGSGHGKTSGRGQTGQRSRAGRGIDGEQLPAPGSAVKHVDPAVTADRGAANEARRG